MNRQLRAFKNKENKGFNTTDLGIEVLLIEREVLELKQGFMWGNNSNIVEEAVDIIIFGYGIAQILGFNMEEAYKIEGKDYSAYNTEDIGRLVIKEEITMGELKTAYMNKSSSSMKSHILEMYGIALKIIRLITKEDANIEIDKKILINEKRVYKKNLDGSMERVEHNCG